MIFHLRGPERADLIDFPTI